MTGLQVYKQYLLWGRKFVTSTHFGLFGVLVSGHLAMEEQDRASCRGLNNSFPSRTAGNYVHWRGLSGKQSLGLQTSALLRL